MKVAILLLLAFVALSQISVSEAFWPVPWLGLGPWALGGFGPWGFGFGFRRFGLGGLGLGFRRRFFGKRDVETVENNEVEMEEGERTLCSYTSKNNMISCHGVKHNFQCKVAPHFEDLKRVSYRIQNLTVVPDLVKVGKIDHQVYNLFSVSEDELNDFTMVEKPETKVTFSLWRNKHVEEKTGLRFDNEKCWRSFETMMNEPENVRFALFINRKPVVKSDRQ